MTVEEKLGELGLSLPEVPGTFGSYVRDIQVGPLLFLAGTIGRIDGKLPYAGQVGKEVTIEQGYEMARRCTLTHLAVIRQALGDLERVAQVVRLLGYVNSAPGFTDQPKVVNGASDLLVEVYGDRGRHTRAAIGVSGLALNAPVETELIVAVRP
ncbi:MAG: RidA family protein [Candidatus Methylomirabilales bacterium]